MLYLSTVVHAIELNELLFCPYWEANFIREVSYLNVVLRIEYYFTASHNMTVLRPKNGSNLATDAAYVRRSNCAVGAKCHQYVTCDLHKIL